MSRAFPDRKKVVPATLGLVAVIGGGLWWFTARSGSARDSAAEISASGTVEADSVQVGAQRAARLMTYRVAESQSVKAGEVIAVLDPGELDAQLEQAEGQAAMAAAKVDELVRGSRPEDLKQASAQVEQARANLSGTRDTLANARLGYARRTALKQALDAATAQRDVARAALEQAESAQRGADQSLVTAREEHDTSVSLTQARDAARRQLEGAEASRRTAAAQLQQLRAGPRAEEIQAAEAQLGQAQSSAEAARREAENAAADFARARELHDGKALTDEKFDAARTRNDTAKARFDAAEQGRLRARARLTQLRNGSRKEEIEAAAGVLQRADAAVEEAKHAVEHTQKALDLRLAARGQVETAHAQTEITGAQVANARAALAGAELAVRNARTAYNDALAEKQGVDTARQQLASSQAQLHLAEAQLERLRNGARVEEVQSARAQLQQARGALKLAVVQKGQTVIRAPISGVVTEHVAKVGEVVSPGSTVARVVPLDEPYLTLFVPLPELGKVKLGQAVSVKADSFPNRTYEGAVSQISDTPEFTPRNAQTQDERIKLVFRVKVNIRNTNRELKPGMPADAKIRLQ